MSFFGARVLSTRNPSPRAGASGNETRVASVRNPKSKIENPKSCVGPSAILTGSRTRPSDWGSKARFGPVEDPRNNRRLATSTCTLCVLQIWWLSPFSSSKAVAATANNLVRPARGSYAGPRLERQPCDNDPGDFAGVFLFASSQRAAPLLALKIARISARASQESEFHRSSTSTKSDGHLVGGRGQEILDVIPNRRK